jgi:hypothetical protein
VIRQIKILPMRMSDEGPRLRLPGCTSLPLSPDELRKVLAVVEEELRAHGETWARLVPESKAGWERAAEAGAAAAGAAVGREERALSPESKATQPDITWTRRDVDLRALLDTVAAGQCKECDGCGVRGGCATCGQVPW